MIRFVRPIVVTIGWLCLAATAALAGEDRADDERAIKFFETRIRPLLVARCYECHGPGSKFEGGLRLDSRAAMLKGGDIGPAIKPGDPQGSLLVDAVNHGEIVQMPPKTKLPAAEIADLTAWIAQGAPWPNESQPPPTKPATPPATTTAADTSQANRDFWAFRPPNSPSLPAVKDTAWPQTPIDRFVLSALEARGLKPAPPAERRQLIRRATFDLHGLPPTSDEVDAFLADSATDAFAKVVDRLLASPRYGERWGRHWLDIARYADSNGMDENMAMANAWRYRDYVVAAFNRDLPYDEFLRQQLAGDLLPPADDATTFQRLVATGFLVLGPKMLAEDDPVKMEMDIIDEQVDTIGRAVLGLTLGCARCHDHKFDPIDMRDYYALAGIFKSTKSMENYRVVAMWSERPLATRPELANLEEHDRQLARVNDDVKRLQAQANEAISEDARAKVGRYLLAAVARQRQDQALAVLENELAASQPDPSAVIVEAEKYTRGNVTRDFAQYGTGIGVIYNAGPLPNVAEYDVDLPAAGTYQIAVRYAAAEARPLELSLDGRKLRPDAAGRATGSWTPETQAWSIEGVAALASGRHVLRIERNGPLPHVDKVALLPARFAKDAITGSWHAIGQAVETHDLNPTILAAWNASLQRTRQDVGSVFRLWHAWQQADEQGTVPQADETAPVEAALLRAPRPRSLAELAARYEELFRDAHQAAALRPAGSPEANAPLVDPAQEAFRQVLIDAAGPFVLPTGIESSYPPETTASLVKLKEELARLEKTRPDLPRALAVDERAPQDLRVHLRGSHLTQGDLAPRRFPRVLAPDQPPLPAQASGRLELARWLTTADQPLTGRVMVNRIWQGHFGEGLVRTSDNFGHLGERPDNQPLLDWLACQFVESGWSIKAMHRLVMLSSAYQMSTAYDERSATIDPENRLLWRMNRRRLEAEAVRDAILAIAGQLDLAMGGTLLTNKNHTYVTSTASTNQVNYDNQRRSVYLPVVRSAVYEVLSAFDFADPSAMNGRRASTTVAPQALFMMNSPLVLKHTRAMAEQLLNLADVDDAGRVQTAYLRAYSRAASAAETSRALQFVGEYQADLAAQQVAPAEARVRAWQALCRVVLSSNEFIYVD